MLKTKLSNPQPPKTMTFNAEEFSYNNVTRSNTSFNHPLDAWSPAEWGCALAGEVGELCNLLKKLKRGDDPAPTKAQLEEELGGSFVYLDLLAQRLGINLFEAARKEFDRVSKIKGYKWEAQKPQNRQ